MSRLVDAAQLLANLQKHRATFAMTALDSADPSVATYEYGHKVGYNKGLKAAEQKLEELLKVEDSEQRPNQIPFERNRAY